MTDIPQKVRAMGQSVQNGEAPIVALANVIAEGFENLEKLNRTTHGLLLEEVAKLDASEQKLADWRAPKFCTRRYESRTMSFEPSIAAARGGGDPSKVPAPRRGVQRAANAAGVW